MHPRAPVVSLVIFLILGIYCLDILILFYLGGEEILAEDHFCIQAVENIIVNKHVIVSDKTSLYTLLPFKNILKHYLALLIFSNSLIHIKVF